MSHVPRTRKSANGAKHGKVADWLSFEADEPSSAEKYGCYNLQRKHVTTEKGGKTCHTYQGCENGINGVKRGKVADWLSYEADES